MNRIVLFISDDFGTSPCSAEYLEHKDDCPALDGAGCSCGRDDIVEGIKKYNKKRSQEEL